MKNKIISIILGIILLSSVASFSPTPVFGYISCSTGIIETRDMFENKIDSSVMGSDSGDYNFVMPMTNFFSDEGESGTVKFSYQVQAGGKWNKGAIIVPEKDIGTKEIDKEPWGGESGTGGGTPSFAYGIKLTRPAGEDYVTVTLFCDHSGGREIKEETVTVKHLTSGPEVAQAPETVPESTATLKECLDLVFEKKESEASLCLDKLDIPDCQKKIYQNLELGWQIKYDDCKGEKLKLGLVEFTIGVDSKIIIRSSTTGLMVIKTVEGPTKFNVDSSSIQFTAAKDTEFKINVDALGNQVIELIGGALNIETKTKLTVPTKVVTLGVRGTEFIVEYDSESNVTTVLLIEGIIDATTKEETRTFSGENKFTADGSGIITDEPFLISEWNDFSNVIQSEGIIDTPSAKDIPIFEYKNPGGFESFSTSSSEYFKEPSKIQFVNIGGKVTESAYVSRQSALITITFPDGQEEEKKAYVLDNRQFSIQIRVDDTVTTGEYTLEAKYRNYDSKPIIFTVYDAVSKPTPKILEPKEISIPEWIKNNARWWAEGTIDDNSFKQGIQHMIKENIISIKDLPKASGASENKIPDWVKNNAKWWADGVIGEDDFVNGLKYMVEKGIIGVD